MAREKARPSWDVSADPPDYRTDNSAQYYVARRLREHNLGEYGPSTDTSQQAAARSMAAEVVKQRKKQRKYVNGRWFEGSQLIGTAASEDSPIHRVTPRSLRQRGQS